MTLVVGTNTYVTEADADEYFNSRYGSAFWFTLTSQVKEQLLISATRALNFYCDAWKGNKLDVNQALPFPRDFEEEVSDNIKFSECEIAFAIYNNDNVANENEPALKKMKADVVEFEFAVTNKSQSTLFSSLTQSWLNPYCESRSYFLTRA